MTCIVRSLQAELKRRPYLKDLTPEDGDDDPPEILFGSRRVGYFKAKHLCRVWTLETLKWLRTRGEFFVVWKHGGRIYDGRLALAHAFTIKYLSRHSPPMSVVFDINGALKSTSQIFTKIRRCVLIYMCNHICVFIYVCSYTCTHIPALIYV